MDHLKFAGKVILVLVVIAQIPALAAAINKNYFA